MPDLSYSSYVLKTMHWCARAIMSIFCPVLPLSVTVGAVVGSALLSLLVIAGAICCAIYQTRTKKYNITESGHEFQLQNKAHISVST